MSSNLVESLIGALVLAIAGWFLVFAYDRTDGGVSGGYVLQARFDQIDGIGVGSDVRLAGIKVGTVVSSELDNKTYQAIIRFSVKSDIELPVDTAAAVSQEGLLGGKYLTLIPGGMDDMLADGDEVSETQDALDLLGLIGKFATGGSDGAKKE
ncbi:MAG: outer membrane lipid asymmetry maintenance protein MlaD [Alphaproteobacteria bacterium]|nr:MAG: outer membrane lipid asymmetry maintenance protein MlaD [Alphaproteobacteria bacterium]